MHSLLSTLQDEMSKYTDAIAGITGTDVEIIDNNLIRIAGTGRYRYMLNQDVSNNGHIYRHVLQVQKTILIEDPKENSLCQLCQNRLTCTEELDLNAPIFLNNQVIGVIGIICSNREQKMFLMKQKQAFITFIEQFSGMISSRIFECLERLREQERFGTFRNLIDVMDRGVIAIDSQGKIWHANLSALRFFDCELIGQSLDIDMTGDILYGDEEAWLILNQQRYHVLCKKITFSSVDNDQLTMVIFHDARDYMTQVNTLSVDENPHSPLIGNSQKMFQLKNMLSKVAVSHASVLITGESGSGKEVVAYTIHQQSLRTKQPFITINCAAIPEQLLESELFGYVRGAFSGADPKGRIGKFELAHGGSLFLDEIGDMPLHLQAKLLRVLQEKSITRVGSNNTINIDVRIIAATNKDLRDMVNKGQFREDLFYRLNVVPIHVPALRDHREDIAELAQFFADDLALTYQRPATKIPNSIINYLYSYDWPGNIRELRNVIEYMYVMQGDTLDLNLSHLPPYLLETAETINNKNEYLLEPMVENIKNNDKQSQLNKEKDNLKIKRHRLEYQTIIQVLDKTGYTLDGKKKAAKMLGISIATLYRRINKA
ncbi:MULTISPECIES: sigma-54 interaction domain-containing protein [Proteus]|uniref:Formate hydrogenlyase transcriptional activator n=3 Tax=Enterobacterales TaxID=91347 RepID=A0A379F7H8_PROVU|nr:MULTISPECIES: sigma 54-interacting transcriptional regulator [Proteus]NBN59902.1 signal transduction protein [Proteus sp. G2639]RNT23428.1 signal transduction protein [Proteus mirabilis]AYY82823.1 signal transduction protein [Proteus vulgaris]KGA56213.1 AAA domain family protein [Proteus vulgaris]MBG5972073.1 sigma 54-interacting transcriptional regulator [Proteus vulgaris]